MWHLSLKVKMSKFFLQERLLSDLCTIDFLQTDRTIDYRAMNSWNGEAANTADMQLDYSRSVIIFLCSYNF